MAWLTRCLFFYLGALLSALASAIILQEPQEGKAPRVLKFDLQRNKILNPIEHDKDRLRRRDDIVSSGLQNQKSLYSLNLTLGTPDQRFTVSVDTGSSDLWVNAPESSLCTRRSDPCQEGGTFSANDSSTYDYVGSWFNITYVDGSGAAGDYVTDRLRIASETIDNFQFGVGYNSSSPQNILGIGYPVNEAQVISQGMQPYKNLPARLADDDIIASPSYSLWLNDFEASRGNLLFGGVDRSQYHGELVTVPIQRSSEDVPHSEFFITLTGVDMAGDSVGSDLALAVLLDSGTTLTYLPDPMVSTIYDAVGAQWDQSEDYAVVPCSLGDPDNGNLTFRFSDPAAIDVPLSEMVLDVLSSDNPDAPPPPGEQDAAGRPCMFGISPSHGSAVLGDTFLRSAYVVFDMGNSEVSIAQSKFNATGTDIAEIGTGQDAVPSAVDTSDNQEATAGLPPADRTSSGTDAAPTETGIGGADEDGAAGGLVPPRSGVLGVVMLSVVVGFGGLWM
ncbi:aspartic-type endopeptidase-like protein [Hapsidospora chrysogenum ATCC 11550]|uniref:Probable aspartic-type endopeptidase OPSB n=1 Tax=Hapsidospora chrysogenum (strain ATCC 11550 / CBS 779.69 / DSM 880 / IAM 14645 / JCM 23072 / IMI 49137) TaxID=857340 RepID=A0A086SXE4_HAPC1|nr:aspartic-type endopeptidase-like protein [Hapsidospora chrysogenum ATCC 11550]